MEKKSPLIAFQECIETLQERYLILGVERMLVCVDIRFLIIIIIIDFYFNIIICISCKCEFITTEFIFK